MSNFRNVTALFGLLSCLAFSTNAQTTNGCDALSGKWKGFWSAPYSRCAWSMVANISKTNSQIELKAKLTTSDFPSRCGDANVIMQGTCVDNTIEINYGNQVIKGKVMENVIKLYPEDQFIQLEKIS